MSWSKVGGNGSAVSGYTVTAAPGGASESVSGDVERATLEGLVNGTAYTFTVVATNVAGASARSVASDEVTPAGVPDQVGKPTVTAGDGSVAVSWSKVGGNGTPVTGYTVTAAPGGAVATVAGDVTEVTLRDLDNGTSYSFVVVATNKVGDSAPSPRSLSVTPRAAPVAPTDVVARAGVNSARVSWAHDFGYTATDSSRSYLVTASPGGAACESTTHACTVPGLSNGKTYTFSVVARDGYGASPASAPSSPVTPVADTTAPVLASSSVTPGRVAATGGRVEVELRITDDVSGLRESGFPVVVTFSKRTGNGSFGFTSLGRASGDAYDGTYRASIQVPSGTPSGDYRLSVYPLEDQAQNSTSFLSVDGVVVGNPAAPDRPAVEVGPGRSVSLTWAEPTDDGGNVITGYEVETGPDGDVRRVDAGPSNVSTVLSFPDRDADDPVRFRVRALNSAGPSAWSSWTDDVLVPAAAPGAPRGVTAQPGVSSARVTWAAPASAGGSAVTSYLVTAAPGGRNVRVDGDVTEAEVEGLENGIAYTFTVVAINGVGSSEASARSAAVTPTAAATAPGSPREVRAVAGDGVATVSWSGPSSDGGSAVTAYTVTASPGGRVVTVAGTVTQAEVEGLQNGIAYTFTVVAANDIGTSSASGSSESVTPAGAPGRPAKPLVKVKRDKLVVKWTTPENNGSPISGYVVSVSKGRSVTTTGTRTRVVIRKARPGNYKIRVAAVSDVGTSAKSAVVRVRVAR